MVLHITSGEILNEMLKKDGEQWIPFNEAMIKGNYTAPPFSEQFMIERAKVHAVSIQEYKKNMSLFLDALKNLQMYEELDLYFGNEPFCCENIKFLLKTLSCIPYDGKINLYTVNEESGQILSVTTIQSFEKT